MHHVNLRSETDWNGWRMATRSLVLTGIEPGDVTWSVGDVASEWPQATGTFNVSRGLVALAESVIQARHPDRFGLLYSLVWRANTGEKLSDDDADMELARQLALAVRADAHRMRTNVRFLPVDDGARYLGWYAPAHHVLAANIQLMAERFADLDFSIATPDGGAHADHGHVRFGPAPAHVEDDDSLRAWWDSHGKAALEQAAPRDSIPATENVDELPRRPDNPPLGPVVIHSQSDTSLRQAAHDADSCERCPLYAPATQIVFGEGPAQATVMFIGEQPGDQEDTIGRPFVGPAGQMMDKALEEARIDRRSIYITNAVKHFKFTPRGKRRIHQTPENPEIRACSFWLDVERVHVKPRLAVLMGGTAARAAFGRAVTISRERGRPITLPDGQMAFVTVHPSYLLRLPDAAAKAREYDAFVRDLQAIRAIMESEV
jgi:uracil-DNA glycosylase